MALTDADRIQMAAMAITQYNRLGVRGQAVNPYIDAIAVCPFNGTIDNVKNNGVVLSPTGTSGPVVYAAGKSGQCLSCNNNVQLQFSIDMLSVIIGTFSIAFWTKIASNGAGIYPQWRRMASININGSYLALPEIGYSGTSTTNKVALGFAGAYSSGSQEISDGRWHLIVITKNNSSIVCYLDNAETEIVAINNTLLNGTVTANLTIHHPTYLLGGYIDHFCVWDYGLSSRQMDYIWNGGAGRFE